ncbi:hypothetical protein IEO21_05757 [Rhodonia placenta]|uniref:Uncharacterized protein n=1 Tax=Rhodonia placenta TaxID=104341 RepID=A0A8H7P1C4_9APHY|nr:hypothetical protein IEO21_05757 [Postia placenta]
MRCDTSGETAVSRQSCMVMPRLVGPERISLKQTRFEGALFFSRAQSMRVYQARVERASRMREERECGSYAQSQQSWINYAPVREKRTPVSVRERVCVGEGSGSASSVCCGGCMEDPDTLCADDNGSTRSPRKGRSTWGGANIRVVIVVQIGIAGNIFETESRTTVGRVPLRRLWLPMYDDWIRKGERQGLATTAHRRNVALSPGFHKENKRRSGQNERSDQMVFCGCPISG